MNNNCFSAITAFGLMVLALTGVSQLAMAQGPSFACDQLESGSIEELICNDEALSALDRTLAGVYEEAFSKADSKAQLQLKAEQRGWIKGRNDCWKADDTRSCVQGEYQRRIAELQARYQLVPHRGPLVFACDGYQRNEVGVTFFETEPPTLIAMRGNDVALMYLQPSASGTKYEGANGTFWERHGEAMITWGNSAMQMYCKRSY